MDKDKELCQMPHIFFSFSGFFSSTIICKEGDISTLEERITIGVAFVTPIY